MLRGLSSNEVFGSVHGFNEKCLHALANVCVIDFEKTVLESAAARGINLIADLVHAIGKGLKSSWIWGTLAAEKCTIWETLCNLLSNIAIGLVQ